MTRVLLVHQPIDGGVGRHVRDLERGLGDLGFDVVRCSPEDSPEVRTQANHRHLDMQRAIAPRADLAAVTSLGRVIDEVRPDVVHAHSSKAGAICRIARLAHPRIPLVYSPHLYAFAGYFKRSAERHAYRAFECVLAPAASRVVCVCEDEARLARSIGPQSRVRVVYNGVPPADEGPIESRVAQLRDKGPIVGTLTLLHPRKGLRTLIDAVPLMLEGHPHTQVAIVGDGPELATLRNQTQQLHVDHAVHFLGPSADPLSSLRGMDVFVLPSWAESFPYVILEAMSVGRSIVATDVGGTREAIGDGESGLLVPPRDDRALSLAVIDLLNDPERRMHMGKAALRRTLERFTLTEMIEHLADVYEELGVRRSSPLRTSTPNVSV
jgi:glycosyltransferase involved in cell wall biosynthesis